MWRFPSHIAQKSWTPKTQWRWILATAACSFLSSHLLLLDWKNPCAKTVSPIVHVRIFHPERTAKQKPWKRMWVCVRVCESEWDYPSSHGLWPDILKGKMEAILDLPSWEIWLFCSSVAIPILQNQYIYPLTTLANPSSYS